MLHAAVGVRVGSLDIDVEVAAAAGELVVVVGPNGAGKTTVVRALAGLVPIDSGSITLDGRTLDDPAAGIFVPPAERSVGMVFQDYLLFPRLSALENVAFGLRARGEDRRSARVRAQAWLDRFGVGEVAGARPSALSGGQAQRVALARAVAVEPGLLLLDEPLAALDASTRVHVRAELRHHLASLPGVRFLVTHDPIDALVLADRLVIMEQGRITQTGTAAEVAAHPATPYVANLVGINLLRGRLRGRDRVQLPSGGELAVVVDEQLTEEVAVAIRPQAVALHLDAPEGSPRNTWPATIADLEAMHDRVRVTLGGPVPVTAEITADAARSLDLVVGSKVFASVKAVDIAVYDA